jgi:ABC-2 type transport system ATP-binding protein
MSKIIISVRNLVKKYADDVVLNGLCLEINENDCIGIVGKNGAGKTTLLECIEGLRMWQGGEILIDGQKLSSDQYRKMVGVQLQSASLPDEIKAKEAIELFAVEHSIKYDMKLVYDFGVDAFLENRYKSLSTGQKRRLHLLLAVLHDPSIIILDEPTAGLDVEGKKQLYDKIEELKHNKTIIVTSHDLTEIEKLCDRTYILFDGIVADTLLHNQLDVTNEGSLTVKTVNKCLYKGFSSEYGRLIKAHNDGYVEYSFENATLLISDICRHVVCHDDKILDLFIKKHTLEDKFLQIIEGGDIQ